MATLAERAEISNDGIFINRVKVAMLEAAIAIVNEDPQTASHAERATLALQTINSPDEWARRMAVAVVTNPNTGSGSSDPAVDDADGDSALQFVVASIWNAVAGVST